MIFICLCFCGGCTTIRVVDPPSTADLNFLLTGAAEQAIGQLSTDALRDCVVYVDTSWLIPTTKPTAAFQLENELARQPALEYLFLIGELRAKTIEIGRARLKPAKKRKSSLKCEPGCDAPITWNTCWACRRR